MSVPGYTENIKRIKTFLEEGLNLPSGSIEFIEKGAANPAASNLYVSTLMEGYGKEVQHINEIKQAARSNASLSQLKRTISKRTGIPEEAIVFRNPNKEKLSGNYHVSTVREMYENVEQ